MIELKTLKELDKGILSEQVLISQLRQEAIKWIKHIQKNNSPVYLDDFDLGKIGWIKHFFNITEEDVKC